MSSHQNINCNIVPTTNGQGINMSLVNVGNPIATIITFPSETEPENYMICDGSALLRADYPELFAVISTTYGNTDGTDFFLPDYRGVFLRGLDLSRSIDTGRTLSNTIQDDKFKDHTHTYAIYSASQVGANVVPYGAGYYYNVQTGLETSGALSGSSTETRPKNVACVYMIKYQ